MFEKQLREKRQRKKGEAIGRLRGIYLYSLKKHLEILARFFTLPLEIQQNCV